MLKVRELVGRADAAADGASAPPGLWVDLSEADEAEIKDAERRIGAMLPGEIHDTSLEPSRRLRDEGERLTLTVTLPPSVAGTVGDHVSFVLFANSLVTLRSAGTQPFVIANPHTIDEDLEVGGACDALLHIFETIIAVAADRLEELAAEIEEDTGHVFDPSRGKRRRSTRIEQLLSKLGDQGTRLLKQRECLAGLARTILFLRRRAGTTLVPNAARERLEVLHQDVKALAEHAASLDAKIAFLLDAVLGLVSLDQNDIAKMLSVTAAIFLPPTLISSIYGMNFRIMPDLGWQWGFYFTIGVMFASAAVTWGIFRWRRWL